MGCDHLQAKYLFWDAPLHREYRRIGVGASRAEVLKRMGRPFRRSETFELGQYEGNEQEYARAAQADSAYYLSWSNGIDYQYCIGFGADDNVAVKGAGGT